MIVNDQSLCKCKYLVHIWNVMDMYSIVHSMCVFIQYLVIYNLKMLPILVLNPRMSLLIHLLLSLEFLLKFEVYTILLHNRKYSQAA